MCSSCTGSVNERTDIIRIGLFYILLKGSRVSFFIFLAELKDLFIPD